MDSRLSNFLIAAKRNSPIDGLRFDVTKTFSIEIPFWLSAFSFPAPRRPRPASASGLSLPDDSLSFHLPTFQNAFRFPLSSLGSRSERRARKR